MVAIPVNLITGFLGSGKTTLLRHVLADPSYADCAVLINELGEIGIDHHLIERIDGETVLMRSGCVCCTIRDDLADAIRSLHERREAGTLPPFRRLIIETTGLADPTPVLATIMTDIVIRHHFRLGNVITTVDAVNGETHLDRQPESVKQAAVGDRLVITKVDIADPAAVTRLEARLAALNPAAPRLRSANAAVPLPLLVGEDAFEPESKTAEVRRWLVAEACHDHSGPAHDHGDPDVRVDGQPRVLPDHRPAGRRDSGRIARLVRSDVHVDADHRDVGGDAGRDLHDPDHRRRKGRGHQDRDLRADGHAVERRNGREHRRDQAPWNKVIEESFATFHRALAGEAVAA